MSCHRHNPGRFFPVALPAALAVLLALALSAPASARTAADSARDSAAAVAACCHDSTVADSLRSPLDTIPAWSAGTSAPRFDFSDEHRIGSGGSGWVWVFSSILIVIGLLYLFLYLLRRFFQRPGSLGPASGQFQLLQQFHLGPKKQLALVKVCGRVLLLGVTDSSINTLLEISDEAELKNVLASFENAPGAKAQNFREIYQGLLRRNKS
ncbi:flagellar biosynthetic protein FliO [bacterium]|nr:flagellar biosynthetic protein FliO [bacterium]